MTTQQTTAPEPQPLLVSLWQAAKLLSVSKRTVQNYVALKALPARKLGRRTLIPYSALVQFTKRDHVTSTAPQQAQ
jgi:excisionase family DNA binding protein